MFRTFITPMAAVAGAWRRKFSKLILSRDTLTGYVNDGGDIRFTSSRREIVVEWWSVPDRASLFGTTTIDLRSVRGSLPAAGRA